MKIKIGILFFSLAFLFITSGCDKSKQRMEVIKDCTGVYLRAKNGQDFKVCNESKLDNYATGAKVKVTYDNLNECFGLLEPITCELAHEFEGKIEIIEVF